MAGDGWANDVESQINIVDCFLYAAREAMMFHSTRIQATATAAAAELICHEKKLNMHIKCKG